MKKGSLILGSFMLTALTGYGAWLIYKKMNPECANEIKDGMKQMAKKAEAKVEDMM